MEDGDFWTGVATGLVTALVGVTSVWYMRRQTISMEGPKEPELSLLNMEWLPDEWLSFTVMTTNKTSSRWKMTSASLTIPVGGKLISEHDVGTTGPDYDPTPVPLSAIDTSELTNSSKPRSIVAPAGSVSRDGFYGQSDGCQETFLAYIPDRLRANSISIVFTLEDNALTTRQSTTTLIRKLPDKITKPIP